MPTTRIDSTGLWLPRITYHRPHDERRVELIGVSHAADQHFYRDITTRLDKATPNGETVCFEGVKPLTDSERAQLNPTQLHATTTLRRFLTNAMSLADHLGLAKQKDLITPGDEWKRTDLGELDLIRSLGTSNLTKFKLVNKAFELTPPEAFTNLTREAFIESFDKQGILRKALSGVLLDRNAILRNRDAIGAQGILAETAHGRDVVALWGNSHLPGIGAILTTSGFEPAGTSDHLAISRNQLTTIDEIEHLEGPDTGT